MMETKEFVQEMDAHGDFGEQASSLPKKRTQEGGKNRLAEYIEKRMAKGHPGAEALLGVMFLVLGFFFSKTAVVFGAIPLGIGLLCCAKERLPEIGVGMLLGLLQLGATGLVYGSLALLVIGLRLILSRPKSHSRFFPKAEGLFGEAPSLRLAVATVAGILAGAYQLLVGGTSTDSLLFALAMLALTPLSCLCFGLAMENPPAIQSVLGLAPMPDRTGREDFSWKLGALSLVVAATFVLRGVELFGISLALALAATACFFVGKRFGGVMGMLAGLFAGVVALPTYAPAFGLAGLVSGVLWPLGGFFALGLGVAGGTVWSAFIGGLEGFLTIFPELSLVAVLLLPALKKVKRDAADPHESFEEMQEAADPICFAETATADLNTEEKMLELSGTLTSLSKLYKAFCLDLSTPKVDAAHASAVALCTKRCQGCAHREGCWGKDGEDHSISRYLSQAVRKLYAGESVEGLELPPHVQNTCAVPEAILEDAREAVGELVKTEKHQDDQSQPTLEYDIAGAMMRDVIKAERANKEQDPKLADRLKGAIREEGVVFEGVSVQGKRQKQIDILLHRKPAEGQISQLHQITEQVVGGRLAPFAQEKTPEGWRLSTHSVKKLTADTAVVMRAAAPDQVSGDTVRLFEHSDGRFFALLSDGMGSGAGASAVSGLCVSFLQKLMEAGCHRTTAVKLLNQTIRHSSEVGSTTLDLAEIDLLHGDAVFLKAGASASYVKRGTQLFRVRSKTIPLGLMKSPDTEKTRFRLEPGDVVVLLSDGISQMPEDSPALCGLLSADWGEQSLQEAAGHILSAALTTGERADDMTVVLVRVKNVEDEA